MKRAYLFAVFLIVFIAGSTMVAQNAAYRGKVVDDSNAVMIGAAVTVKRGATVVTTAKTDNQGTFSIQLAPGDYSVAIAAEDFETLTQNVHVAANMPQATYTMKLAEVKTEVQVNENANVINLDPDSNLTATLLDQDFIEQLPDDPTELQQYLTDLAGPRANAAGGVDFIIDGFSNGTLPPKDQILQIRINNNPFSTEFVRPGFGRIEIVTKPGTGQYHGSMQFSGRDDALDANTFYCSAVAVSATTGCTPRAPYQRKFYIGNISGPIIKNRLTASFNASYQQNNPSSQITDFDPITGNPITGYITQPATFSNYNSRGQWSITPSQRHILNYNLQYQGRHSYDQGVGGTGGGLLTLPEGSTYNGFPVNNSYTSINRSEEIQLRETEIISSTLIHELRYEWDHSSNAQNPAVSSGPQYTISQIAQFGSADNYQETKNTNYQIANALSYTGKILTLKMGIQSEHFNNFQYSLAGFQGSYTYQNIAAFQGTGLGGSLFPGAPQTYTVTTGNPNIQVYEWTLGTFLQTDWKAGKKWLLSGGARYSIQTNDSSKNGIDPRGGFAYQLNKTTVLRGGFGTFHQQLSVNTVNNLIQYDGQHQLQTILNSEVTGPITAAQVLQANSGALVGQSEIYVRDPNLTLPYTINSGVSIEKTLPGNWVLTGSFDDIKTVHGWEGRDLNAAPLSPTCTLGENYVNSLGQNVGQTIESGCVRPIATMGIIDQLENSSDSRFDSVTVGFRERFATVNLFGSYTYSINKSDSDGANGLPSNNFDLRADWGYSGQQARDRIQTSINYAVPMTLAKPGVKYLKGFLFFSNIVWQTGSPWNQTINSPGEDGRNNQRLPGVPINNFIGPQRLNVGLNVNKTFILREGHGPANPNQRGQGGGGGGFGNPGGGGGGRGGPGGGGPGGGGGRGGGPGAALGPGGISMTVFANTFNTINYTNLNNPGGVLGTQFYGISTTKNNPRVVELGIRVNF